MMNSPCLTVRSNADLVAQLLYEIGYVPDQSVALALQDNDGLLVASVRFDLASVHLLSPHDIAIPAEATLCSMVCFTGAFDEPSAAQTLGQLFEFLDACALDVRHVVWCADNNLYVFGGQDCHDYTVESMDAVWSTPVAAHHVLQGRVVLPQEQELIAQLIPPPGLDTGSWTAEFEAAMAWADPDDPAQPRSKRAVRSALRTAWHSVVNAADGCEPSPLAVAACSRRSFRDSLLLWAFVVAGSERLCEQMAVGDRVAIRWADGVLSEIMDPHARLGPDLDRLRRVANWCALASALAPTCVRGELLAMQGWLWWVAGQGMKARVCVEESLRETPQHSLARLVDTALRLQVAPGWVRAGM